MAYANTYTGVPNTSTNSPFFGNFPLIDYDINNILQSTAGSHETITDVFFRVGFIKQIINNLSAYYVYEVQDGDTPEILAERFYGDKGAGWVILYANEMYDPQFDWALPYDAFNAMIIDRYGSLENAQTTVHHSEMIITRTNQYGDSHSDTYTIDLERKTESMPDAPYPYFTPWTATTFRTADSSIVKADSFEPTYITADITYDDDITISRSGSIPLMTGYRTYELNGLTITETVSGRQVSYYDWELENNNNKKLIKVIKAEYYPQIRNEFKSLAGSAVGPDQMYLKRIGS